MWIELKKGQYPTKDGCYKCLVEVDEMGTLEEMDSQVFRNGDWCHYKSCRQFIRYWWNEEAEIKPLNLELSDDITKRIELAEYYKKEAMRIPQLKLKDK